MVGILLPKDKIIITKAENLPKHSYELEQKDALTLVQNKENILELAAMVKKNLLADLEKYDIRKIRDWVQLDEDRVNWSWDMFNFDTQAAWLKGRYKKGNIYVCYKEDIN